MSRGVWFLAGTAAGAYAVARGRRAAESFTVGGMHDRLTGWFAGARVIAEEVGQAKAEKESELHDKVAARTRRQLGGTAQERGTDNVRQLKTQRASS